VTFCPYGSLLPSIHTNFGHLILVRARQLPLPEPHPGLAAVARTSKTLPSPGVLGSCKWTEGKMPLTALPGESQADSLDLVPQLTGSRGHTPVWETMQWGWCAFGKKVQDRWSCWGL
jgi:hypothetical protein